MRMMITLGNLWGIKTKRDLMRDLKVLYNRWRHVFRNYRYFSNPWILYRNTIKDAAFTMHSISMMRHIYWVKLNIRCQIVWAGTGIDLVWIIKSLPMLRRACCFKFLNWSKLWHVTILNIRKWSFKSFIMRGAITFWNNQTWWMIK